MASDYYTNGTLNQGWYQNLMRAQMAVDTYRTIVFPTFPDSLSEASVNNDLLLVVNEEGY